MRKTTSLTLLLMLIPLLVTSIVLYIVPHGRVAYWADWRLWGLSKTQWGDIHITSGTLFCAAGIFHIIYNWRAMISYMKRSGSFKMFTKEFNIALVITLFTIIGTYFTIPPFSWILHLGERFKDSASQKYGMPPYGHAELSSLKTLCKRMSIDLSKALENLRKEGIKFSNESDAIISISQTNNKTPQEIYQIMQGENNKAQKSEEEKGSCSSQRSTLSKTKTGDEINGVAVMPHGMGVGKMTINQIADKYSIEPSEAMKHLKNKKIKFENNESLKEIAEKNDITPYAVYEALLGK